MVNREDISRRARAKSLAKRTEDRKANPEKYTHEMSERSIYLGLDWDFKHGAFNGGKVKLYEELKAKYGELK